MFIARGLTTCFAVLFGTLGLTQEPTYPEFRSAFDVARVAGDKDGLDAAIRLAPTRALFHFTALCKDERLDSGERLKAVVEVQEVMKAAWRRVYGHDTVLSKYQAYYADQTDDGVTQLYEAEGRLRTSYVLLIEAQRAMTRADFELARDGFREAAEIYKRLEDALHAAEAWQAIAFLLNQIPERTPDDYQEMIYALEQFMEARETWDWTADKTYEENFLFLEQQAPAGRIMAARNLPFLADAEEIVSELEFKKLSKMEPDLFAQGGPLPLLWPEVQLFGESFERLPVFKSADLFLRRVGNNSYSVSFGAASVRDATSVQASSTPKSSEFFVDRQKTKYAMWFYVGAQDERFMSAVMNLAPNRNWALVFYRSAASWKATLDREKVIFYDDNCDGMLFNPDPFQLDFHFLTLGKTDKPGTPVPTYDSMRIGNGRRIPYSEVALIGGKWYTLRGRENGEKVGFRPLDPERLETGKVMLEWEHTEKSRPEVLVIQGKGKFSGSAFEISSGNPVEVPVGEYEIGFGRIVVGSSKERQLASIFRGDSERFAVKKGETFTVEMGAPFALDYVRDGTDTDLVIDSTRMRILGRSGAIYVHPHNAVPTPNVLLSFSADGASPQRIGRFLGAHDGDTANKFADRAPLLGRSAISFPLPSDQITSGDPVMRVRIPKDSFIGLQQDVHLLFSKLWPVWKGTDG